MQDYHTEVSHPSPPSPPGRPPPSPRGSPGCVLPPPPTLPTIPTMASMAIDIPAWIEWQRLLLVRERAAEEADALGGGAVLPCFYSF